MTKTWPITFKVLMCGVFCLLTSASYALSAEDMASERAMSMENIRKAEHSIQEAATPVLAALTAIQRAEQWNPKPWNDLEAAVKEYQRLFDHHWRIIDFNMSQLVTLDPNAAFSQIRVSPPDFSASIKAWMELCQLIDAQKMKAEDSYHKLNKVLDLTKKEANEAFDKHTWNLVGEIIPVPTQTDPGHIATKIIELGAAYAMKTVFLPIFVAKVAIVDIPVAVYNGMDELSSSVRAARSLEEVIKNLRAMHDKLSMDLKEAQQGHDTLAIYGQQFEGLRNKVKAAKQEWAKKGESTQEKKQAEAAGIVREIEQKLAEIPNKSGGEFYAEYFKPYFKPFDWGGYSDPNAVLEVFESSLHDERFVPSTVTYSPSPAANIILEAWQIQNWAVAFTGGKGVEKRVPAGIVEQSIDEYTKKLMEEVHARGAKEPDSLVTLRKSLAQQEISISRDFNRGSCMSLWFSPRCDPDYLDVKPPAGETAEQRKARQQAGEAIMKAADARRASLQPTRDQISALSTAWQEAIKLAEQAVQAHSSLVWMTHAGITTKLMGRLAKDLMEGGEVLTRWGEATAMLSALSLPPEDYSGPEQVVPSLTSARQVLRDTTYTHLGPMSKPPEPTISSGLLQELASQADKLKTQARNLRQGVGLSPWLALDLAARYEASEKEYERRISDFSDDLPDIQWLIQPGFLEQDTWRKKIDLVERAVRELREAAEEVDGQTEQTASNLESDAYWLMSVADNFQSFLDTGRRFNLIAETGDGQLHASSSGAVIPRVDSPYAHYLTTEEKGQAISEMRLVWSSSNLSGFSKDLAPWLGVILENLFQELSSVATFPEENFFVGTGKVGESHGLPVTATGIAEAQRLLFQHQPGTAEFAGAFGKINQYVPVGISYPDGKTAIFNDVVVPAQAPLAEAYIAFRGKVKELYGQHVPLAESRAREDRERAFQDARRTLPDMLEKMRLRLESGNRLINAAADLASNDKAGLRMAYDGLGNYHQTLLDEPYSQMIALRSLLQDAGQDDQSVGAATEVANQVGIMSSRLYEAKSHLKNLIAKPEDLSAELKDFYQQFQEAYQAKNDSRLMSFLSDDWSAGDGTTLMDLEDYFRNMFSVFDDIQLNISGLRFESLGGGRTRAYYELQIVGRIFADNLKHEEKSSVVEEVEVKDGKVKIVRTPQGRFWYSN